MTVFLSLVSDFALSPFGHANVFIPFGVNWTAPATHSLSDSVVLWRKNADSTLTQVFLLSFFFYGVNWSLQVGSTVINSGGYTFGTVTFMASIPGTHYCTYLSNNNQVITQSDQFTIGSMF